MRKVINIIIFIIIITIINIKAYALSPISYNNQGYITVEYSSDIKTKLKIENGERKEYYDLNNTKDTFSLHFGNGNYKISILENTSGNRYKSVYCEYIDVSIKDENSLYLKSIQNIKWNYKDDFIFKAKKLTYKNKNNYDKVKTIYEYIIKNFKYKTKDLKSGYLPDNNTFFKNKEGICYDFTSFFASIMRSQNIPAKLVMGYCDDVEGYHAWNEVLINGKWIVIDLSYDSQVFEKYGKMGKVKMFKDGRKFRKSSEY